MKIDRNTHLQIKIINIREVQGPALNNTQVSISKHKRNCSFKKKKIIKKIIISFDCFKMTP